MKKTNFSETEIDILGSIEFDLTEVIKDLIYHMKSLRRDVDSLKETKK